MGTIKFCDRCGKHFEDLTSSNIPNGIGKDEHSLFLKTRLIDMCADCWRKFTETVSDFMKKDQ